MKQKKIKFKITQNPAGEFFYYKKIGNWLENLLGWDYGGRDFKLEKIYSWIEQDIRNVQNIYFEKTLYINVYKINENGFEIINGEDRR